MSRTKTLKKLTQAGPTLGRRIVIPASMEVWEAGSGYKAEYYTPTVMVTIGIGDAESADLIMSVDAWEELKNGAEILYQ